VVRPTPISLWLDPTKLCGTNVTASSSGRHTHGETAWPVILLVGLVVLLTPVLVFVGDGNVGIALVPVLGVGFLYLLFKVPLRYPTLVTVFLALTLEDPADRFASGTWETPLRPIRALFFMRWNLVIPVGALVFSGMDLMLLVLLGIALYRRATRSRIDADGLVETASPVRFFVGVAVFGALWIEAWGAARGGTFRYAFVQMQHVFYPALYFFLFHYAFRGPQDHPAIAKTVVAAACIRAAMAFGIRHLVQPHDYLSMPTATTHGDSLLFAGAFCLCIVLALEMPGKKKYFKLCALVLPILILGMVANNRRLVWVQLAEALLTLYFVMPMSRLKLKVLRRALVAAPVIAIYLVAGWNSAGGALFAGARTVRSLVDPKSDGSTEWRDFENHDLVTTLKSSPLLGLGYGHPFLQPFDVAKDISGYELELYQPHNSLLGLWAFGGIVGFTFLWTVVVVGAFFAVRSYKRATRPPDRATALGALALLVAYLALCYGDVGYSNLDSILLVPLVLCVLGKLALVVGAWPSKVDGAGTFARGPERAGPSRIA
jgi:hypothetical protein